MPKTMKVTLKLVLLLALPAAVIDALNNIYNIYIPIYLQAGGSSFGASSAALTFGFGIGAGLVGLWMTADNILGFFLQPLIAAWSDRTQTRLGRRLPYLLFTAPLLLAGFALIPIIPTLIPPDLNGQQARLVGLFLLFTGACMVYYLGFLPQRVILQTLRQEVVAVEDRTRLESWYTFIMYFLTILAYVLGGSLYTVYGPLLFWVGLGVYAVSIALLVIFFREPQGLVDLAPEQEKNGLKQLLSVFKGKPRAESANLIIFLASMTFFVIANSGLGNFVSSWMVDVLEIDETRAATLVAIYTIGAALAAVPAGMIAAGKFGRRRLFCLSLFIALSSTLVMVLLPGLYILGLALFGIGLGSALVTMLPLATELNRTEGGMGSIVGVFNLAYAFGFLIGANLFGWVIQLTSYDSVFPLGSILIGIAALLSLLVRGPQIAAQPAPQPSLSD